MSRPHRARLIGLLAAMSVSLALPSAGAASIADLAVTATGTPASVSPPGGIVLYRISVANHGPSAAPADLVNVSTGGGSFVAGSSQLPAACAAPADGTTNPTIVCRFDALLPAPLAGSSTQIAVALRTPSTEGSVTNSSTVSVPPSQPDIVDDNASNDVATVTTPVLSSTDGSAALVQEGETLAYRKHLLRVRDSENGVIAYLSSVPAGTTAGECGGDLCGAGVLLDFDPDPYYQGSGVLEVQFDATEPCRGLGAPAACGRLFVRKNGTTRELHNCVLPAELLCIEQRVKVGADFRWTVRVDSTDPEFIPPLPKSS